MNVGLRAKKDFGGGDVIVKLLAGDRPQEMADDWKLESANEIGHEDESVLEHTDDLKGLSHVVVGDLAPEVADTLLKLVRGDDHFQGVIGRHHLFLVTMGNQSVRELTYFDL